MLWCKSICGDVKKRRFYAGFRVCRYHYSYQNPEASTVSVHKEVFSYEGSVATSVMEAAAFSLSMVDHGLDDSAIASISFMVARSTSPTPVK